MKVGACSQNALKLANRPGSVSGPFPARNRGLRTVNAKVRLGTPMPSQRS